MKYDHAHAYVRVLFPPVVALLALLHLPYGWLVRSGELPHHPDCTPTVGVIE